jgi:hypothetical protein
VRGCDLLNASVPKFFGIVVLFVRDVTTRTPSSILASFSSSKENRVESQRSL